MREIFVILLWTIIWLSIWAFIEDYYREIVETQARIIEDLSISLEERDFNIKK